MGKEDVYTSDYLENAEVFADLVNGVLYHGEQVVKPGELSEQDGELRSVSEGTVKKTIRDKVRLWKGAAIVVLSVENQTRVDYRMVIRAMLSESMAYDRQWKKLREKWRRERRKQSGAEKERLTSDEFISGMRKEDKFMPVITIVVYYGKEKPWDGARTLHELLDVEGYEEKIFPFVSNYRLNLFDYHEYEEFGQFRSELQSVFEFLRYSGEKEQMKKKLKEHREQYEELSSQAKILLTKLTNIKKIPGVSGEAFERGEFSMCKAFEDMKEEGKIEGRIEGKIEGREEERESGIRKALNIVKEFGGSREQGITSLIKEYKLSKEGAMEKVALYW